MNTFEKQRQLYSDLDFIISNATTALVSKTKKDHLIKETHVAQLLSLHQYKCKQLLETYQDPSLPLELQNISVGSDLQEFYKKVKEIKLDYAASGNEYAMPSALELNSFDEELASQEVEFKFTGEEGVGRFLDLISFYNQYLNLKSLKKISYIAYLQSFFDFHKIPMSTRQSLDYKKYVNDLCFYLESFIFKSQPLFDFEKAKTDMVVDFEKKWSAKEILDWTMSGSSDQSNTDANGVNDNSLYCSACCKTFTNTSVFEAHKTGKKHLKASKQESSSAPGVQSKYKQVASYEFLIVEYTKILDSVMEETMGNVERKQTLTERERLDDMDEVIIDVSDAESDHSEHLYNPLKLPMGWDGKPIPYWLFKLHGLGVQYPCEICGNFVYMGRQSFQKHFNEWRHTHGMRCLGIPYTKHFADITLIKDAYALYERIQNDSKNQESLTSSMEEFEDEEGNVFNKKTYEDLKRQGLL